jgi:hypothetical protein
MTRAEARRMAAALALLLLGTNLSSCRRLATLRPATAPPTPAPQVPSSPRVGAVLPRPLTAEGVTELVYGNGEGAKAVPGWRPKKLWQGIDGPGFDAGTQFVCKPGSLLPFREGEELRAFVLSSARTPDHDCEACSPLVGAVALTEVTGGWRIDAVDPEVGDWGIHGEAPDGKVVQLGPLKHGVMIESFSSQYGVSVTGISVLAETRNGGFAEILSLAEVSSENGGDCGEEAGDKLCWEYSSDWRLVQAEGRDLWDFQITKKGSRQDSAGSGVEEFSETLVYRFDGVKYVLPEPGPGPRKTAP